MSQNTRMTRQRFVILDVLRKLKTHPTADEVYALVRTQIPRISLGTVYRNLDLLAESGEIIKIESAGSQKRFDGDIEAHQHVRCAACGRIGDVMPPIPLPLSAMPKVNGFQVQNARVEFDGICHDCEISADRGDTVNLKRAS